MGLYIANDYLDGVSDKELCKRLFLKRSDLAKITGLSAESIRLDKKAPIDLKIFLMSLRNLVNCLAENLGGNLDKAIFWIVVPNAMLGGLSPRYMILVGNFNKVVKFVYDSMNGDIP